MKLVLVVLLLSLFSLASASEEQNSDVVVLTSENFDQVITENKHVLVEFYAPWCGHCKKLAPIWEELATKLKGQIVIAKVDATQQTEVAGRYDIKGYPTIFLLSDGQKIDFAGDRTLAGFEAFIKKKTSPTTVQISDLAGLKAFVEKKKNVAVYFGADATVQSEFRKLAGETDDFSFAEVSDEELTKEFGATFNTVQVFTDEGELKTFTPAADSDIKHWFSFEARSILQEINGKLFESMANSGRPFTLAFISEDNKAKWIPQLKEWATTLKNKIHVTWGSTKQYAEVLPRFGASGKVVPTLVAFSGKTKRPLAFDESVELNTENAISWLNQVIEGKAKGFRKSEEEPKNNDGPVKVVVGKNFESVVFDKTKDVLLEIYATWCGHCKQLAPIYEKLGKIYAPNKNVVIAKLEGTQNGYPEQLTVEGFPSIFFFPANSKDAPLTYSGNRDLKSLFEFVKTHASTPVEIEFKEDVEDDEDDQDDDDDNEKDEL